MRSFFIFDVESVGLHGESFAVASGVYLENGSAQWEFCMSCPSRECEGDEEGRKWIASNVPKLIVTHRGPTAMRMEFWSYWMKAKSEGAIMAAECLWPVEAGFLIRCIHDDIENRRWSGPYPIHEIASFMLSAGMDPMATYERNSSELTAHHPLMDTRLSARLLAQALAKVSDSQPLSRADFAGVEKSGIIVYHGGKPITSEDVRNAKLPR